MTPYVIKSWSAKPELANGDACYVRIEGRAPGFISWLLGLMNISPTMSFLVTADRVTFKEGSLAGSVEYQTPCEKVCSTVYGYTKPWKPAIILGIVVGLATFCMFGIPGLVLGVLYYLLNRTLTIGYTDEAGTLHLIEFKRSVIEEQNIDERAAQHACAVIQDVIDRRRRESYLLQQAHATAGSMPH